MGGDAMATGGARPGAGAKKGQHRVHVKELKDAIETMVGVPFQEVQATVFMKLFNDFKNDENIKEFLIFNENMCRRILEQPVTEVQVSDTSQLSTDELKSRLGRLVAKSQTPTPVNGQPIDERCINGKSL
jgi:hypothetical protein